MIEALLFNAILVGAAVVIHYEILYRLSRWLPLLPIRQHMRILFGVFGVFGAHVAEVWLFALGYWFLHTQGWGELHGNFDGSLLDSAYFSFTTYTTLGFGDIEPLGSTRYLAGIESLTGLLLITWSATFLYFEMERCWAH